MLVPVFQSWEGTVWVKIYNAALQDLPWQIWRAFQWDAEMSKQLKVPSLLFCESFIMDGKKKIRVWFIYGASYHLKPLFSMHLFCKDVFFALFFFSKLE